MDTPPEKDDEGTPELDTFTDSFSGRTFRVVSAQESKEGKAELLPPKRSEQPRDIPLVKESGSLTRLIPVIAGLFALLVGGGAYWLMKLGEKPEAPAITYKVTRRNLRLTVEAVGTVKPEQIIEMKSRASGTVRKVYVQEGDSVQEDGLLVEIDPIVEQRAVEEADAEMKMAEARRSSAFSKFEHARAELKRDTQLEKKGLVSREEVDALRKEAAVLKGDLEMTSAAMLKAKTASDAARDRLRDTKIFAPISGTVLDRMVNPGQVIVSGTSTSGTGTTLLLIADLSRLFVFADVDEATISKVRAGQSVEITSDGLRNQLFHGVVKRVAPQGRANKDNVITFEVLVEIDEEGLKALRPMMTTDIGIFIAEANQALTLPVDAVMIEQGKGFVVLPDHTRKEVKIGLSTPEYVEIRGGLSAGAQVLRPDDESTEE